MGRVPPLVLSFTVIGLVACEAETPLPAAPPPPPSSSAKEAVSETAEATTRDAGDAAREAIERASEALRKLGAVAVSGRNTAARDAAPTATPQAPVEKAPSVDLEAEQTAERDASAAAAEAKDKFVEVTKRAVESVRAVGQGVVDAIRDEPEAPAAE